MPVPLSTLGGPPPNPLSSHPRPAAKRGRQRRAAVTTTSHTIDVNSQLLEAISQEKTSVVRRLISSGADPNTCSSDSTRDPALTIACSIPSTDTRHIILGLLLAKGASVDATNSLGQTSLMCAAIAGDVDVCCLLLDAGASIDIVDCNGNTALCYAAQNGHDDTTRKIIGVAKHQGCDIDHRNMKGLTALLLACQSGHLSTARVLVLEGGASPSIRDLDNFTTAAEWMQRSGKYSEEDLKFLVPASRKKSYYRRQRQEKGIKTLSDYLSSGQGQSGGRNVFTISESTELDSLGELPRLPPSTQNSTNHQSRSMFDMPATTLTRLAPQPSLSSPFRKKSTILPRIKSSDKKPNLSFSHDYRSDLYRSRYLKQRQVYVTPNRQSEGLHTGSLEPLPGNPLERISHNRSLFETEKDGRDEVSGGRRGGGRKVKHNSLPPL